MICPNIIAGSSAVRTYCSAFVNAIKGFDVGENSKTQTDAAIAMLTKLDVDPKRVDGERPMKAKARPDHSTFMEWVTDTKVDYGNFYTCPSILNYPSKILTEELVASPLGYIVGQINVKGITVASLLNIVRGTTYNDEENNMQRQYGYDDDSVFAEF